MDFKAIFNGLAYLTSGQLQRDIRQVLANQQREEKQMTENQSQLDAALAQQTQALADLQSQQQTDSAALTAALAQLTTDIQTLISKAPPATDFTSEVDSINAQLSTIATVAGAEHTAVTGATETTTTDDQSVNAAP